MMLDLIIGKKKDEALRLANLFLEMIKGNVKGDDLEPLEEASILQDVSHMPARVKCAVLGWHTMEEMFKESCRWKMIPASYFRAGIFGTENTVIYRPGCGFCRFRMQSIGKIPLLFTQSVSSNAGNVGDDGK